jgi:anti-repressor protein
MNTNSIQSMPMGVPAMSSLEIATITGKPHGNVLQDISRILAEAQIDQKQFLSIYKDSYNRDQPCLLLPRRECDLVVSGYSVKYRLAIIDRWHELESQQSFKIPQTLAEALRLSADLADKVVEQQAALAIAAPKVAFHDAVTESSDVCQLAVAAQVAKLPFGRNILFQKLRQLGVLISGGDRHNLPKQEYIKRGYFTVNERKFDRPDTGEPIIAFTTYATQKGIAWIIQQFGGAAT